jgi:hypothetical protein
MESNVQASDLRNRSSPDISQGVYSLALGNARQQSSSCLAMNNESIAWSCTDGINLRIDISTTSSTTIVSLGLLQPSDQLMYGQQPPEVYPTELHLGADADAMGHEPLYSFKTTYNRTVLLPATQLSQIKDATDSISDAAGSIVQPKDSLWLCFFNETTIEGLVYAPLNDTVSRPTKASKTTYTPRFPYILRLIEQHYPNGTLPYCERRKISEDGRLLSDGTAKHYLSFSEPSLLLASANSYSPPSSRHRRDKVTITDSCRCEWVCEH